MARAFTGACAGRPAGVSFRPTGDGDLPFLRALYASTREAELAPLPWPPENKQAFLMQQFEAQHAYYHQVFADADFLLILRDAAPIGRIYVHRTTAELCVIDIALLPQHRGHGIGSALLNELIDEAGASGREINLYVEPHNPAQRLYYRLGFRLAEHRGIYDYLIWSGATAASAAADQLTMIS